MRARSLLSDLVYRFMIKNRSCYLLNTLHRLTRNTSEKELFQCPVPLITLVFHVYTCIVLQSVDAGSI